MNLLLDTHVLLWWLGNDPTLAKAAGEAIADPYRTVYVSSVTAWEISIKRALGKLDAPDDLAEAMTASHFVELPISIAHALAAGDLPKHHSDPFDRMLVAQARSENLTLVTRDPWIDQYEVQRLRA